jgi:ParB family chromosome partitioning protein
LEVCSAPAPAPAEAEPSEGYSAALTEDLTHIRTAALAYEVSERPEIGLALAVHTLALRSLYLSPSQGYGFTADQTCIRITAVKSERPLNTHDDDNMAVFFARREQREKLQALVPKERADLFDWCMQADQATLLTMLAFCVADQIDGTASSANATNARQADKIAEVIGLDMAKWWKPSEGFFKRITKKMIAGAASDVGVPREVIAGILDAPKSDAIRIASDAMEGKGWIPPLMRTRSVPVLPEAANDDAAANMIAAE